MLGVHTLLEYPLWYAYFLGLFALLLGMADENPVQVRLDLGPVMAGAVTLFGAISLFNLGINYAKLEDWYTRGKVGRMAAAEIDGMFKEMGKMRHKSLLTPYIDLVVVRALPDTPQFIADKLTINGQVMRFRPGDAETYNHATLLAFSGRPAEAQKQLQRAIVRHPGYVDIYGMQLLKPSHPETLPLVMTIVRHNRAMYGYDKKSGGQKADSR